MLLKIYQYMKSLGLQKVYFTQLFLRLAAMMLGIWAAFSFGSLHLAVSVCSFSIYGFFHHFFCFKDLYKLRSEYKNSNLSPEEAIETYQADMCLIHTENSVARILWWIAFLGTVIPFFLCAVPTLQTTISRIAIALHFGFLLYEKILN